MPLTPYLITPFFIIAVISITRQLSRHYFAIFAFRFSDIFITPLRHYFRRWLTFSPFHTPRRHLQLSAFAADIFAMIFARFSIAIYARRLLSICRL
jgi:hypothetical protein